MIRFDHITKQYPGTNKPALNSIDLEILRGEFVFLVGASGSGKSSCLRLVLKEEKPTSGRIHVLGQDLRSISNRKVPYFRRNLGVVFQDFRLLPNKSVYDNVAFSLQVIGKSRGFIQEAVPDTLEMVGLAEKAQRLPHELSGGEQQRVAIARAIVNKPQILLADEPTGNLDPTTSAGIMALLARINEGGTTVVMATHEAGIVDQMKRRVIELSGGQIVRDEREGAYKTSAIPVQKPEAMVVPPAVPVRVAGPEADPQQGPPAPTPAVAQSTPVLPPTAAVDVPAPFGPGAAQAPAPVPASAPTSVPAPASVPASVTGGDAQPASASPAQPAPAAAPAPVTAPIPAPTPAAPPVAAPETAPVTRPAPVSRPAPAPVTRPAPAPVSRPAPAPAESPAPVSEDAQEHVAEQLTLAEKLGLRAPGERPDHTGEQNVGPTR
ncbi:cell division ATP-binding protein FtsE [Cryobacterium tepidiphilum]|uniref:Cell division ATP-binding protein FtsE n=1 Tax=Cryobacterium tepidiphilum TaxID=2486026 RepID=A0A3M8L163_9MICO|nr:cell division ATP-binding protein FtsE [Cryobacterium tepidiphilum]RNE59015.1 cell division ATP-binding protein FtsE [Cryobacterium tepidiphilum]